VYAYKLSSVIGAYLSICTQTNFGPQSASLCNDELKIGKSLVFFHVGKDFDLLDATFFDKMWSIIEKIISGDNRRK